MRIPEQVALFCFAKVFVQLDRLAFNASQLGEYLAGFLMQFSLAFRHNAQAFAEEGDSALVIHMQADEDCFFFSHLMIIHRT